MEDMYDQYSTSDNLQEKTVNTNIKTVRSGILQEVEIAGQKFHSIDLAEFTKLQNLINNLRQRLLLTEQSVQQLQSQLRQRDKQIVSIKEELDTKVSHER
jgi:radical SAM superfamily enzyme